jgi:hypothetical protein
MQLVPVLAGLALCLFCLGVLLWRDWPWLTRPPKRVQAIVTDHKPSNDEGVTGYTAIFSFQFEGAPYEVLDLVTRSTPHFDVGSTVGLTYPYGRPDLARVPRPWLWGAIYAGLLGITALLLGKLLA